MIHRINIFLICLFVALNPVFLINSANASAAEELWKYEPTLKDMKVNVTAHKVDHLGNAVNDNTYKTQIDPKTAANKTAQGKVGMNRLLKVSGWGLVGAAALEALLEAVGWVMDPESQSIWRNKKTNPNFSCKNFGHMWKSANGFVGACPADVAEQAMKTRCTGNISNCQIEGFYVDQSYGTKIDELPANYDISKIHVRYTFDYAGKPADSYLGEILNKDQKIENPDSKEYLTPDELSDYINHTHPDYADPTLAPKLEPKYKPNEIVPPLWKPQTDYEYDNSPTVDIIKKDLDKQNPTSPDKEIEQNPETGGMSLPNFCDWAKVVCDFVKDFNKEPDLKDRDNTVQIDELPITPPVSNYFSWNAYCPFQNQSSQISINDQTSSVDSDLSSWCTMASEVKPFVIAAGSIASLMIISGVGIKED